MRKLILLFLIVGNVVCQEEFNELSELTDFLGDSLLQVSNIVNTTATTTTAKATSESLLQIQNEINEHRSK